MKKLKKAAALLAAFALVFSASGCGANQSRESSAAASSAAASSSVSSSAASSAASATITVTDHNGNSVTVPRDIQRIAVCDIYPLPSVLAVFFDSADKIVGMPSQSMSAAKNGLLSQLYPKILSAETGYIDGTTVNTEELLKLKPDVVFYSAADEAMGKTLTSAGFAAIAISAGKWGYDCLQTLDQWIALLDEIFPGNSRAKAVSDYGAEVQKLVKDRVSGIADSDRAKVFFLFQYSAEKIATGGKQSFGSWWASAVGAVNVSDELTGVNSAPVSMEQITLWNPQKIFVTNFNTAKPSDLYGNAVGSYDWSGIAAVQNKQVYKMPLGMYRSYTAGADTPVTLLWLAKTVYPSLFADIDVTAKTKDYYQKVFGITLTDAQAEKIFAPAAAASAF